MAWTVTRDKFFSKEERNRLLKATEEKAIVDLAKGRSTWVHRWMLVDLALFSGLRVSEIRKLRFKDIHLTKTEKVLYVRDGKGDNPRYVTIDSALAKHIKEFIEWKVLVGEATRPHSALLTSVTSGWGCGVAYTNSGLQKTFKACVENAGLPEHYSIHSCRHTFATYLYAETKNLRLVQKQLGHSSPTITAVYADVTPEDMQFAMESLRVNS